MQSPGGAGIPPRSFNLHQSVCARCGFGARNFAHLFKVFLAEIRPSSGGPAPASDETSAMIHRRIPSSTPGWVIPRSPVVFPRLSLGLEFLVSTSFDREIFNTTLLAGLWVWRSFLCFRNFQNSLKWDLLRHSLPEFAPN